VGHPQAYGVTHYLDYSLLDEYSVPVKKLHHKTISHHFSRVADIRGHKDNISAAKKTPNKIWCKVSRECIKFPTFTKYQKSQQESS
jgi:alpha-D-ribose 1-methylphosphonate 5-triphosphate synthase subunit PhnI